MDAFMQEIGKPTTPAIGTTLPQGPEPQYYIPPEAPPPPPEEAQRNPDEPMFRREDAELPKEEQPAPQLSLDKKRKQVRALLLGEDFATSRICGIVAGTDQYGLFKYSEDDINTLLDLLEPYYDMILDKIPGWIPLIMVWGGLKTQQIMAASKMYKVNKANAAARTDKTVLEKVANAANGEGEKERTNFKITKRGEYQHDRYGRYLKLDEPKEKAELRDIERILESNKVSIVKEAFNLSDADLKAYGIEE